MSSKVSVSTLLGTVKAKTAIRIFRQFAHLKKMVLTGNISGDDLSSFLRRWLFSRMTVYL